MDVTIEGIKPHSGRKRLVARIRDMVKRTRAAASQTGFDRQSLIQFIVGMVLIVGTISGFGISNERRHNATEAATVRNWEAIKADRDQMQDWKQVVQHQNIIIEGMLEIISQLPQVRRNKESREQAMELLRDLRESRQSNWANGRPPRK